MKNYLPYLFLIIGLLSVGELTAGGGYKKGYVITLAGDTLYGYLHDQNNRRSGELCLFRTEPKSPRVRYLPGEISGYRYLDGKYYVSRKYLNPSDSLVDVFMEYLVNGIADIYFFVDDHGDHYFIQMEGEKMVELNENDYYRDELHKAPPKYKGRLTAVMKDTPAIREEIGTTTLDHQSLIKLARDYHGMVCEGDSCIVYERKHLRPWLDWNVNISLGTNHYLFGTALTTDKGPYGQVGGGLTVCNLIPSNDRFQFNVNALLGHSSSYRVSQPEDVYFSHYISYKGETIRLSNVGATGTVPYVDVELDIYDLSIPMGFSYRIGQGRLQFLLGTGITPRILLSENGELELPPFEEAYGKLINTLVMGYYFTGSVELKLNKGLAIGLQASYTHLINAKSLNADVRLQQNSPMGTFYLRFLNNRSIRP